MFKDSNITKLDAWSLVEEADALPDAGFPAFIGTGKIGIGLDAAGLQSLPDRLCKKYHCVIEPYHTTQADLYLFHDGMLSEHLWNDEIKYTNFDPNSPSIADTAHRNLMPLGFITQSVIVNGETYAGDDIRRIAVSYRRDWSLREGIVTTQFAALHNQNFTSMVFSVDVFAPHGGETAFIRLSRTAHNTLAGDCEWSVKISLETRNGLAIYDQPGALDIGDHTVAARIDGESAHKPVEPYTVVYALAAAGDGKLAIDQSAMKVTMSGKLEDAATTWLRLDLRRLAGDDRSGAAQLAAELESQARAFSQGDYEAARCAHVAEMAAYWQRTADIEVVPADSYETKHRFMLHMSEYLLRCGNDWAMGGSAQLLLMHQNGWQAGNFHDHHYIVDGVARAGMFDEAVANVEWMRKVMRPTGRVFPWIINYDGGAPIPAERDHAPMSDANRAMLAVRIYELAGAGRDELLRETVYPIVSAVADQACEWFERVDTGYIMKGVDTDVMDGNVIVNEVGSVIIFDAVLRKAVAYAKTLGIDGERIAKWQVLVDGIVYDKRDGQYLAHWGAPTEMRTSPWFANGLYLGEAMEFLDMAMYRKTLDAEPPTTICNFPWLNSAVACSMLRLGLPDRAEQLIADTLEKRIHGPGYFEEMAPLGIYALPPLATAHGTFVTAACEQIVLCDLWRPGLSIGLGLPSRLRAQTVRFHGLRAIRGITVSGVAEPRRLTATLTPSGPPLTLPVTLAIPACAASTFTVKLDGQPADYRFHQESVTVTVSLSDKPLTMVVEG